MAWRCLPSSRNEEVSACTPAEKRRGERARTQKGTARERQTDRERREKRGDLAGPPCRDGFSRESGERVRGAKHRGSGTRDWGPPGFEERRNVESTTQRGEPSRGIKSRSGLYCTLSRAASRRVPSTIIADVAGGQLCAINESLLIRLRASRAKAISPRTFVQTSRFSISRNRACRLAKNALDLDYV